MNFGRLNIVFILLFFASIVSAQTTENSDEYVIPFDSLETKDKINYNFEMGLKLGSSNNFGSTFSTYYKPSVSYQVSKKLIINTGLLYVNSDVNSYPVNSETGFQLFSGNISEYYAFVNAQYRLTDKLSVGGSVYYNFTNYNPYNGVSIDQNTSSIDHIGYSANFKYKVAKGITIEGEIRMGERYSPFYQNQNSSFNSSFGNSFYSPFGTW
jgi:hypothetical protein